MLINLFNLQIQRLISSRVEVNMSLEQDKMEGVDEREWVSDSSTAAILTFILYVNSWELVAEIIVNKFIYWRICFQRSTL